MHAACQQAIDKLGEDVLMAGEVGGGIGVGGGGGAGRPTGTDVTFNLTLLLGCHSNEELISRNGDLCLCTLQDGLESLVSVS